MLRLNSRFVSASKASAVHLVVSCAVAGLTALLVFGLWYPWPLSEMLGGRGLFLLILTVDIACGPLLTLILWNPKKPRREMSLDMTLIACLQVGALLYGLYTVAIVRPVYLVFEVDRIRVVSASEVDKSELDNAQDNFKNLPWSGPKIISVRDPLTAEEFMKSVELSIAGKEPSLRPDWWQDYAKKLPEVIARAKPVQVLKDAYPNHNNILEEAIRKSGMPASELLWLPLTSAKSLEWVVLVDKRHGKPRAYAPIDGFL